MSGLSERRWPGKISLLTLDGGTNGLVTVADVAGFYTKQKVSLSSATVSTTQYEIKRVVSPTELFVGPTEASIDTMANVSQFLIGDGAQISAGSQQRPGIDYEHIWRYVFAEEPVVAIRVMPVDQYGDYAPGSGDTNLVEVGGVAITLGQKTMAASIPVVVASDNMVLSNPVIDKPFDTVVAGYPDLVTETYEYFAGGAGGTSVGLVTVTYTDVTKAWIDNFEKTPHV